MYTIINADSFLYPWVVLTLKPKQGKEFLWCMLDDHAETDILEAHHTKSYKGIVLDSLPTRGGTITQEEKNRL